MSPLTKKMEEARSLRNRGYSCTQAVAMPFAQRVEVPQDKISAMALPFAGGMTKGSICGALTGAYLVAGLLVAGNSPDMGVNRTAAVQAVQELDEILMKQFGCLTCKDMLGCDPHTPEGIEHVSANGLKEKVCMTAILSCVAYLETLT